LLKTKKQKKRPPTVEEMLRFKPMRLDFDWFKNDEGLVEIKVPKFTSNFGKSFCRVIRKDNTFCAKMDKIGSVIWEKSDGKNSVKDILNTLEKNFPDEENLDQRLFLFLQQMYSLNYLRL
jgi:hypothetical protein